MNKAISFRTLLAATLRELFARTERTRPKTRTVVAIAMTVAIAVLVTTLASATRILANDDEVTNFTVDVAFRNPYFQNNVDPAEKTKDGVFSQGDTFIQDGSIYPQGTIPDGKTDFDPETPGAIGTYRARGTWTTDLANFLRAAEKDMSADPDLAFATELFSFGNERRTILTDGALPNAYFSAHRVVLGGTGSFRDIIGEVHEVNIGENKTGECNLRVTFKIRRVGGARWH